MSHESGISSLAGPLANRSCRDRVRRRCAYPVSLHRLPILRRQLFVTGLYHGPVAKLSPPIVRRLSRQEVARAAHRVCSPHDPLESSPISRRRPSGGEEVGGDDQLDRFPVALILGVGALTFSHYFCGRGNATQTLRGRGSPSLHGMTVSSRVVLAPPAALPSDTTFRPRS